MNQERFELTKTDGLQEQDGKGKVPGRKMIHHGSWKRRKEIFIISALLYLAEDFPSQSTPMLSRGLLYTLESVKIEKYWIETKWQRCKKIHLFRTNDSSLIIYIQHKVSKLNVMPWIDFITTYHQSPYKWMHTSMHASYGHSAAVFSPSPVCLLLLLRRHWPHSLQFICDKN